VLHKVTANVKALLSVKEFEKQKFELMPNIEPKFEEILAAKREYYGWTEAAIQFAAEEYARQLLLQQCSVSGSLPVSETIKEIENIMERWHLARDNDAETLQGINDALVKIGLLAWFNRQ
jgi:hypothetical protein